MFLRDGDGAGPEGEPEFQVWVLSTPRVLVDVGRRLRSPGEAAAPALRGGRTAVELATAHSDFALDALREGGLPPGGRLPAAVAHLRFLTGLLPTAERAAFLFACWLRDTGQLTPARRVDLGVRADRQAGLLPGPEAGFPGDGRLRDSWEHYTKTVRGIVADRRPGPEGHGDGGGVPLNYLLFEHARLAGNRLGIPRATEALAARALRAAWRAEERAA
ncbi:hypothetical protein [Streptomyces radicis]|uniref:Thiopeptide-type bacteriocin biosynthesis domain-containing protein n=1 Tax=Streptomyces radicis TaxID=1750517 RepID=A0A3A9W3D6_9ACTN|nr:hypothetical protein [Streptomyces radicis]RKN07369.1 hypothetical protein D7319_18610 [Streptomyces radicis]RKN19612.1 hypothetical protein D7318_19915 [Streptomyces radicis]